MNKQAVRALIAAPVLSLALATSGFVAAHAAEAASAAAPAYGPGMMGGYGPGRAGYGPGTGYHRGWRGGYDQGSPAGGCGDGAPWTRGGGYGMGPWMMGGGYGGFGWGSGMMGGGYRMGPGVWRHGAGPGLGLTDAQQKKIDAIEDAQFKKQWALMPQMHAAMLASRRNFETGKINVDAAMKSAKAMEDLRLQMLRNHLETIQQIDAVLTPAQRAKLQQGRPWGPR